MTGENRNTWGKTCPSATLSTTNPTLTDPGSTATNRLSHGTARGIALLFLNLDHRSEKLKFRSSFNVINTVKSAVLFYMVHKF
jgi:hypothetical protein